MNNWITIKRNVRGSEDLSSLLERAGRLEVVGILPHASSITPNTLEDARALRDWLLRTFPELETE